MAISQQYTGKMRVPWFNTNEWKYVMDLIHDEDNETLHKMALNILRTWKTRTNQLPQGVEGTLIILEAMMQETNAISEENLCLLYGTHIMRFLNICGANADKQGTFYKTAIKHNLPRWLIELRHDIAHSQTIPSKYVLELALKFCFDWLKREYWDKQKQTLTDFIIVDNTIPNDQELRSVIDLYCQTKLTIYQNPNVEVLSDLRDSNETIIDHLSFLGTILGFNPGMQIEEILNLLLDMIEKQFSYGNKKVVGEILADVLLSKKYLLNTEIFTENSCHKIPNEFLSLWADLLELLYNENHLILLINRLLNWDDIKIEQQQISSLWLNEIFVYLSKLKEMPQNESQPFVYTPRPEGLHFIRLDLLDNLIEELKETSKNILSNPQEFYLNFLEPLLLLTGYESNKIEKYVNIIKQFTIVESHRDDSIDQFHTLENLPDSVIDKLKVAEDHQEIIKFLENKNKSVNYEVNGSGNAELIDEEILPGSRWRIVKNPQVFAGCPLGLLPNQGAIFNPLLELS